MNILVVLNVKWKYLSSPWWILNFKWFDITPKVSLIKSNANIHDLRTPYFTTLSLTSSFMQLIFFPPGPYRIYLQSVKAKKIQQNTICHKNTKCSISYFNTSNCRSELSESHWVRPRIPDLKKKIICHLCMVTFLLCLYIATDTIWLRLSHFFLGHREGLSSGRVIEWGPGDQGGQIYHPVYWSQPPQ